MKTKPVRITVTEGDYLIHRDEYDGVCLACGAITYDGVEPDAEEIECEACGAPRVIGFEQALLLGRVRIEPTEG